MSSSRLPGFYNKTLAERHADLSAASGLSPSEWAVYLSGGGLTPEAADHMVENVVGTHALPLGIGLNFMVNGRDVLVPMAIEEPSVVAAASHAARIFRGGEGMQTTATDPIMLGQIQLLDRGHLFDQV